MTPLFGAIVRLHLDEWSGLALPFLVLLAALGWLLTSVCARWANQRTDEGARLQAKADRRLDPSVSADPPAAASAAASTEGTDAPSPTIVEPIAAPASEPPSEPAPEVAVAVPELSPFNRRCKMDLAATKSGLELTVELPGVEEKDLKIEVANDVLTISGHMSFEPDREERNYRLVEREYGVFSRSIDLPEGVPPDRIKASLSYGVLKLTIPNPTRAIPRTIELQSAPMQVFETTDGLELTVDVPGLEETEVEVSLTHGLLRVQGEKRAGSDTPAALGGFGENRSGRLSRSVELPSWVNADQVTATLSNGVLTVSAQRPAPAHLKTIKVRAASPRDPQHRSSEPLIECSQVN